METSVVRSRGSLHGFRAVLLPAVFMLGATLAIASLHSKKTSFGPVAVVFPPWWSTARCLASAAAGGAIVNRGAWPFIVIVSADEADPDKSLFFPDALLILDAETLRGCAPFSAKETL